MSKEMMIPADSVLFALKRARNITHDIVVVVCSRDRYSTFALTGRIVELSEYLVVAAANGRFTLSLVGATFGPVSDSWETLDVSRGDIQGVRAEVLLPSGDVALIGFSLAQSNPVR